MKLRFLIKNEFVRLIKYKVLFFSVAVTAMWIAIIALLSQQEALMLAPLLIIADLFMMTILLLAAMYYYEKQEGTLITTLIAPVKISDLILSKYITHIIIGIVSSIITALCLTIFHKVSVNYALLIAYAFLIVICSCSLGYAFVYYNKDFSSLLVSFALLILILFVPSILYMLDILPEAIKYLLFVSPIHCSQVLITSALIKGAPIADVLISLGVLLIFSSLFIGFIVIKKFKAYALRG